MLQIYLYQYWTVAETQKKGRSAPRLCVDLIIIIIKFTPNTHNSNLSRNAQKKGNFSA